MAETTFEKARVGDRVYAFYGSTADAQGHNATITDTAHSDDFPIVIQMDDYGGRKIYNLSGAYYLRGAEQSLFWCRPEIAAPERPKRKVRKYIGMLRDSQGQLLTVGYGARPTIFETREEALAHASTACEIEIEE